MFVFAIMPFAKKFDTLYREVIKVAFEEHDYSVARADDILSHQNVLKDIIGSIFNADLIVVEITMPNQNVYYELGIAHALNKPTIILTQNIDKLPFDLRNQRVIPYSSSSQELIILREQLSEIAKQHKLGKVTFGNPVNDYLALSGNTSRSYITSNSMTEKNGTISHVPDNEPTIIYFRSNLENIGASTGRLSERTSALANNIVKHSNLLSNSVKSGNKDGIIQAQLLAANELDIYSAAINSELSIQSIGWQSLLTEGITILNKYSLIDESDIEILKSFRVSMLGLATALKGSVPNIVGLKESISKLKSYDAVLHPKLKGSATKAVSVMDKLISILQLGTSYIDELISKIDEVLN